MDAYGHAEALGQLESENPQQFTWNGAAYNCQFGTREAGKELDFGGYAVSNGLTIVVRSNVFTGSQPAPKQLCTCDSTALLIDKVDYADGFIVLTCSDATKGA